MPCLDTSVVIDFLKGEKRAAEAVQSAAEHGEAISVASITAHEILFGTIFYRPDELRGIESFFNSINVLNFDLECAKISGNIRAVAMRKGKTLGIFDALIAATAIANGEMLITKDRAFQEINRMDINIEGKEVRLDVEIV